MSLIMNHKSISVFLFLTLLISNISIGQTDSAKSRKKSLSFSVSNNGQVDHSIHNFYRQDTEFLNFLFNTPTSKHTEIKYNLSFSYVNSKKIVSGVKLGYQSIINKYSTSDYTSEIEAKGAQSIYNINPSLGYAINNKKLDFIVGLQVPLFIIGNYKYTSTEENYRTNASGVRELQYISETETNIIGGYITGLNSFLNLRYSFNRFFIFSEVSTGILYASTGASYSTETTTTYSGSYFPSYPPYYTSSDSDYTLKKTYFSSPEFSFGIGLKF